MKVHLHGQPWMSRERGVTKMTLIWTISLVSCAWMGCSITPSRMPEHLDSANTDSHSLSRRLLQLDPKTQVDKVLFPYYPLSSNIPSVRKVIYTFWGPVTPLRNGERGTGMTDESDDQMFKLWKQAWEAIGWEPRILTIDDAKKHPRFPEFYDKLQSVPLLGNRRKGVNKEYNQWCYIRWLAMEVVGGGWMSDYDVLPIRRISPRLGAFTVYESGVPSLVSGTQEEWAKMAWAILENGVKHNTEDIELWSDMNALADLKGNGLYQINQTVIEASFLLTGKPWTQHECNVLQTHNAIHFSHNSIRTGVTREGEKFRDRPRIAARIMKLFYTHCAPPNKSSGTLRARSSS